jgi:hypothetical protein
MSGKKEVMVAKHFGLGVYFGIAAAILALTGVIGCFMMGIVSGAALLLVGIVAFGVTVKTGWDLFVYVSYACYLLAGSVFLSNQLFTIANEIIAIDASGFQTSFIVAAISLVGTILLSLVGTIFPIRKA